MRLAGMAALVETAKVQCVGQQVQVAADAPAEEIAAVAGRVVRWDAALGSDQPPGKQQKLRAVGIGPPDEILRAPNSDGGK